ncbi:ASI2 (YNL159C) [Zygosaccharomyces parabailii]|uniref:BN860_14554g1_1 n=1 Tax=Zygosaccharomyces bailii (strain CLIB 213 / ATCC 58445 / CBS 680 / BCRC 21525 / NBRC 1098 / NCYC 1416 / NRRL Y-2227) TaxID=1333698 RepID=A0A8J2WXF9_ZYGB2|nr:ASI2 (YNL159C) [Zygosaccharomyces parabailii]CDF88622.1 BN860_14554g1_1 [Zygosaccharomyces bailii CLIB 213]CDH14501.1 related to Protein ASI2 [Zygosaccharomyces bailii ISA1307]
MSRNNDDYLYERFVSESNARSAREQAHETQQSEEELQQELRTAIDNIINTIEQEMQREAHPLQRNEREGAAVNAHEPLFVQRRPFLRLLITNLLLFDYFVVLLLFPFSLYNILRSGFSVITLSENDFLTEIVAYCRYVKVFGDDGKSLLVYGEGKLGLLGKFHNIVVFYSSPIAQCIARFLPSPDAVLRQSAMKAYRFMVKFCTVAMYMTYGIGGTVYLAMAGSFFAICFAITLARRYKSIHRMVAGSLETAVRVPGMW